MASLTDFSELRSDKRLASFHLTDGQLTENQLGDGPYGSVEEASFTQSSAAVTAASRLLPTPNNFVNSNNNNTSIIYSS